MAGLNFGPAKSALKSINPTKIFQDVKATVDEHTQSAIDKVEAKYSQDGIDAIAEDAVKSVEDKMGNPEDSIDKVQTVLDAIQNPQSLMDDVQGAIDDAKSLVDTFKNTDNLKNTKQIESMQADMEEKMNNISGVMDKLGAFGEVAGTAKEAVSALTNPVDFAKDKITELIMESDYVQGLKDAVLKKIEEDLKEIPEVNELVEQAKGIVNEFTPKMDVPGDISSAANNPEKFLEGMPSLDGMIARAVRESGVARALLGTNIEEGE